MVQIDSLFDEDIVDDAILDSLGESSKRGLNEPTSMIKASHAALLSGSADILGTYNQVMGELSTDSQSPSFNEIYSTRLMENQQSDEALLKAIIADPNAPREARDQAAMELLNGFTQQHKSVQTLTATHLLTEDGGPTETTEERDSREMLWDELQAVDDYRNAAQAVRNQMELSLDNEWIVSNLIDFAEVITPFAETSIFESMRMDLVENGFDPSNIILLGESKQEIAEAFQRMPPQERQKALQSLVDIIEGSDSIITGENELIALEALRVATDVGDYSDFEWLLDNAFSMLDIIGVGWGLRVPQKLYKLGALVERSAREGAERGRQIIREAEAERAVEGKVAGEIGDESYYDPAQADMFGPSEGGMRLSLGEDTEAVAVRVDEPGETDPLDIGLPEQQPSGRTPVHKRPTEAKKSRGKKDVKRPVPQAVLRQQERRSEKLREIKGKSKTDSVVGAPQPTSVAETAKVSNPNVFRNLHAIVSEGDDTVARTIYGTSRTDAIVNDMLPSARITGSKAISNKISEPQALAVAIATRLKDGLGVRKAIAAAEAEEKGMIYYSKAEKAKQRSLVSNDFFNITNLTPRKEMFVHGHPGGVTTKEYSDGMFVSAIYGPQNGGFISASEARDLAKFSLRDYGVLDDEIQILKRDPAGSYSPVPKGTDIDSLPDGDYLVQVDYRYKFRPKDLDRPGADGDSSYLPASVRNNFLDRVHYGIGKRSGTMTSHLLDPQSLFENVLSQAAVVQVDRSSRIMKILGDETKAFADAYNKLPSDRRVVLEDLFKEANFYEIDIDRAMASARGLNNNEYQITQMWKNMWDTIWDIENRDFVMNLDNRGYQRFLDDKGTDLIAKPLPKETVYKIRNEKSIVYDPVDGKTTRVDKIPNKKITEMYDTEGKQIAELRNPAKINGRDVTHVMVHNTPADGYLRRLRTSDRIMTYRKGYFHTKYKDNIFIKWKNPKTDKYETLASAKNKDEADLVAKRLARQKGTTTDEIELVLAKELTGDELFESEWDSVVSSGRSAQKFRGERLVDASGNNRIDGQHMMSPDEALANSVRSVSRRVEMRDWLEVSKRRFMKQFGHLIEEVEGVKRFPSDMKQINSRNRLGSSKDVADARSTWEYIRAMEEGYGNLLDDSAKALMRGAADFLGGRNNSAFSLIEENLYKAARGHGLSNEAKKRTFQFLIALVPQRQILIQAHQIVMGVAFDPKYMVGRFQGEMAVLAMMRSYFSTGKNSKIAKLIRDPVFSTALKNLNMKPSEAVEMYDAWVRSGLENTVDTHNLVREDYFASVRGSVVSRPVYKFDRMTNAVQEYGFNIGERLNMMGYWLIARNRAIKDGKDLTKADELDYVTADARNMTYNMNRGGDMPYNSNVLNVAMQFAQVPHKALTQIFFNRHLTRAERARVGALGTLLFGIPMYETMTYAFGDIMVDIPETAREIIQHGLESFMINKFLSLMSEDEVAIDFSSMSPYEYQGVAEQLQRLMIGDIAEFAANAPATTVADRFGNLLGKASRFFNLQRDYEDNPTTGIAVIKEFMKLTSGFSYAFKSEYAFRTGTVVNSWGDVVAQTGYAEATAQFFGLRTMEEANEYDNRGRYYNDKKLLREDITEWYKLYKKHISDEGLTPERLEWHQQVFNEAWRAFPRNEFTYNIISGLISKDWADGDYTFFDTLLNDADIIEPWRVREIIENSESISDERKQELFERLDFIASLKVE